MRDELLHQLNEVQQQKQDILGASQQMGLKFTASQGEVRKRGMRGGRGSILNSTMGADCACVYHRTAILLGFP